MGICDEFIRWLFVDGTKPKARARFALFGTKTGKSDAMDSVRKGKQNNLGVNQPMEEAITWNESCRNLE
jgi:hypothetical protein